jgi:hypothetical protein
MRIITQVKVDKDITEFFEEIKRVAGKGVGHIYALNFCQVASLFGFMPMEMVTWASVNNKTSGAYQAINAMYKKANGDTALFDLKEDQAQKHFEDAVMWISQRVSYQFTPVLAENILCELHRENCEDIDSPNYKESPRKDVLYMYKHRNGVLHPLYRWKTDLRGRISLQVLVVSQEGKIEGCREVMLMKRDSIPLVGAEDSWLTTWTENDMYALSPHYSKYLL